MCVPHIDTHGGVCVSHIDTHGGPVCVPHRNTWGGLCVSHIDTHGGSVCVPHVFMRERKKDRAIACIRRAEATFQELPFQIFILLYTYM